MAEGGEAAPGGLTPRGPEPECRGISSYTREAIAPMIEQRFGKCDHPASLSEALRRGEFSRQEPHAQAAW